MILELQAGYAIGRSGLVGNTPGCPDFADVLEWYIGLVLTRVDNVYGMSELFVVAQQIVEDLVAFMTQNI